MAKLNAPVSLESAATPEATSIPDGEMPPVAPSLPVVVRETSLPGFGAWCSAIVECQQEMATFVAERLAKDQEAIRDVLASKHWTDVAAIQAHWLQQTMQDYTAEMTKVLSIYTKHGVPQTQVLH